MSWAKPKRDETKKSGWAKGISIDEGKNITLPLATTDGQKFGDISYNAYKAIENNTIDSYQPMNDAEKSTIDKYIEYQSNLLTDLVLTDGSTIGQITRDGLKAIDENKLNSYAPKNDIEKATIEKYKQVANYLEPTEKKEGDSFGTNVQHTGERFGWSFKGAVKGLGNFLRDMFAMKMEQTKYDPVTNFAENQGWIEEGYNKEYAKIIDKQNEAIFADIKKSGEEFAKEGALIGLKYPDLSGASRAAGEVIGSLGGIVPSATLSLVNPSLGTFAFAAGSYGDALSNSLVSGESIDTARTNAGISFSASLAASAVSAGTGKLLDKAIGKIGARSIMKNVVSDIYKINVKDMVLPEIMKNGATALAFSATNVGLNYLRTDYQPTKEELTRVFTQSFVFGVLNGLIRTFRTSSNNYQELVKRYSEITNEYDKIKFLAVSERPEVFNAIKDDLAIKIMDFRQEFIKNRYVGQAKNVKNMVDYLKVLRDDLLKDPSRYDPNVKPQLLALSQGQGVSANQGATDKSVATYNKNINEMSPVPVEQGTTNIAPVKTPPSVSTTSPISQPIANEFDELMATDISDVKPGDVYIKKDTGNKITVVDETDKAVKIEVDTGKTTTVRDIPISQAERLKGDEFEKQPTAVNEMALQPETPITADEVIPEQADTSSGEVITLSTPKNKKDFSINTKQYNLFKNAKKIVIGNDIITDGFIAIPKTEEVLGDINKLDNANVTSNDKMSLGKFYDGSNSVVLSGDPKLYEREVEEYVDGTKTGKKILQKSYVFKVGDKLYGVQQKYLDAFNNGKNTFLANEVNPLKPIAVMDGENLVGIIMPVRVDHLQDSFDSLTNASVQIAETKAAAQAKKAEIESRPVDNKTLKEFMEWSNIQYYEADDGKMFVTNGHFLMPTDRNGIDYIVQQNNERNPHRSKIEAVKNENLRKYIENHNATHELTEQPVLQENTYIYTDGSKYFGYNKRYFDIFNKDGNRFFVDNNTDNLNDQFLVVKNTSDEVVGIVMPIKLADNIADVLKDKLPIDVATPKQTEKPIIPDTEKENITVEKMEHSKTGEDIWVVRLNERIGKDEFSQVRNKVKGEGGYWSNFIPDKKGGGFIFKSEPTSEQLERAFGGVEVAESVLPKSVEDAPVAEKPVGEAAELSPEVLKNETESDIIKVGIGIDELYAELAKRLKADEAVINAVKSRNNVSLQVWDSAKRITGKMITEFVGKVPGNALDLFSNAIKSSEYSDFFDKVIKDLGKTIEDKEKTINNKGVVKDVHNGLLERKGENDSAVREPEPVSETEEERDTGTEDRERSEDGSGERGALLHAPEAVPSAEGQHDTGDYDNGVRESNDRNGDGGTGISGDDNVDVAEIALAKAKDFVITKTLAEDLDTSAPNIEVNIKAIETLHAIENSGKAPTKIQQGVLAKFKGWGGLTAAFYGTSRTKLQELMSESELKAAQSTVNDAYFTPTNIIDGIYKALLHLGFEGGNVLEPSMGVGNFFGRMPKAMRDKSSLFGVEIDSISGRIAQMLYPSASIEVAPFQDVAYKDGAFDLIIGNVPFGEVKYKYKGKKYLIHDYFFVKAMDKLNDGGVLVFLTTKGTLDKLNSTTRTELSNQGRIIGAYRLPSDVFTKSAGASVVTDLIVMQKTTAANGESFVNLGTVSVGTGEFSINEYFVKHPENIIGKLTSRKDWQSGKEVLDVVSTGNAAEQLVKAIRKTPKNLLNGVQTVGSVDVTENNTPVQTFATTEKGAVEYIDAATGEVKQLKGKRAAVAKDYIDLKGVYQELIDATLGEYETSVLEGKRKALNKAYDGFVKKHGTLEANKKVLSDDNAFYKVSGLEVYDTKTKKNVKSEMFTKDTLGKRKPKKADNALDALSISIGETGGVNLNRIAELTGISESEVIKQLDDRIIYTPDGTYEINEVYLSGNVREKYGAVKGKKGFEKNERLLKAVLPEDIPAKNITPQFGAPWIKPDYVADFLKETLHLYNKPIVSYDPTTGTWSISGNAWGDNTLMTNKYGTKYMDAVRLSEKALNMRRIVVTDRDKKILVGETRAAQQKAEDIKAAFEEWCFKDADRRKDLVATFNEKFNSNRNMDFSELAKYLTLDGLADTFTLREYQKRAVARAVFNGNTLLAHGVGTGKTAEMIAIAMELKRMGIAKKNMMVVPPHKVADFRNDILKMYPFAKVVALEKGASATQRQRFYALVAANDFDIVIIPHSSFGMLDVSADTKRAFINNQIAELEEVLTAAQAEKGKLDGRFIRTLENQKKRLEERMKFITETAKDSGNVFEELGVDSLFVDEAHNFKNLPFFSKLSRVAGVSVNQSDNKTRASRAENMFMITDFLNRNGGRITFGTATPITNSMSEIYNMLRFLRPDILADAGLRSFDAWASMFGSIVNQAEVDPSGRNMRMKERFSKFKNVSQMIEQFRRMADILKTSEVIQELPEVERIDVINESNDIQEEFLDIVDEMIDDIRTNGQNADHNMLEVTTAGQMAAVDLRFVASFFDGKYTNEDLNLPQCRTTQVATNVYKEYIDSNANKGTQFVFCDVGVRDNPNNRYRFHVYGDLINKLVARGVPRNEIAVAQEFEDKADLSAKVNTGEIRVLIGSTAVMGEGMNAQKKAVALHHVTVPARPSDIEQREGRIVRYGNENKNVRIYRYIQEKSYDSYQWQMQERKANFINQALSGGTVEELEEMSDFQLSAREAKAIASGNPLLLEKIEVEDKLNTLKSIRSKFNRDKLEMQDRLAILPNRIAQKEKAIADVTADAKAVADNTSEDFEITLGKTKYTERAKATDAMKKGLANAPRNGSRIKLGSYNGLDLYYTSSFDKGTHYILKGRGEYSTLGGDSASGNITRIINLSEKIGETLETDKALVENYKAEIETLKKEINSEFQRANELEELQAKLSHIDTQLGINVSTVDMSEVIVDDEPDGSGDEKHSLESEDNYGQGNLHSDGNIGRQAGTDTAQQVKSVARGAEEIGEAGQKGTTERRVYAETLKANEQVENKRKFGMEADFIKHEGYDEGMRSIVAGNKEKGIQTEFILGSGKVMFANGQKNIRGAYIPSKKTVIIQYDHPKYSPLQINRHEYIHDRFKTKEVQRIKNIIANSLSIREKNKIIKEIYRNYYDITAGNEELVFEEFIADVLSGMNDYSLDFEALVNAYWSGSELVDVYSPATYANLIDTGDFVDNIGFGELSYSINEGIGRHKGDLGKAETFASQYGSVRGTGHFGTGTYFVGENLQGDFERFGKDRPIHTVDFSKYNLFTPHPAYGMDLHNALKAINSIYVDGYDGNIKYTGTKYSQKFFVEDILPSAMRSSKDNVSPNKIKSAFQNTLKYIKEMHDSPFGVQRQADSASTHFMKQLGFEGIDVRHIKTLDNTEYGSVIYDLKDSITQTDTPDIRYSLDNMSEMERANEVLKQIEKDRLTEKPKEKGAIKENIAQLARTLRYIPEKGERGQFFAEARKTFILWGNADRLAQDKIIQSMQNYVGNLSVEEFKTFEQLVYLLDLKEEGTIQQSRGIENVQLPNNLTTKDIDITLKMLEAKRTDNVDNALKLRQKAFKDLASQFAELNRLLGFETENKFTRENYFHHQVIDYVDSISGKGKRSMEINQNRGWLKSRAGSTLPINSNVLMADYDVLKQMQHDSYKATLLYNIEENYDIKPQLEKQAFQNNKQFIDNLISNEARAKGKDGSPAMIMRNGRLVPDSETYEQQQWYNKRIMFGFSELFNLASEGALDDYGDSYTSIIKALSSKNLNVPGIYQYVGFLAGLDFDEGMANERPVMAARTIMKYTVKKQQWIKEVLGENFQTWETLAKNKDGYSIMQPRRGNYFYNKEVIDAEIVDETVSKLIDSLLSGDADIENTHSLRTEYAKTIRLKGAAYKQWVIPNEIIDQMNETAGTQKKSEALYKTLAVPMGLWKGVVTTLHPGKTIKFGTRNVLGDLDAVIAGDPGIVKYSRRAMKELYNAMSKKNNFTETLLEWKERGGFQSLYLANELDKKTQDEFFKWLSNKKITNPFAALREFVKKYTDGVEWIHNYREAILRYSAYLYYREKILNNGGKVTDYVASNRAIVNGLSDPLDKAFQLSNDLLGAYDQVSVAGRWIRNTLVPFYSFTETNFKRYSTLLMNAMADDEILGMSAKERVSRFGRVGAIMLKKLGTTGLRLWLLANLMGGLFTLWNHLFFKEEEEMLPEHVRKRPHIVLGRSGDRIITFDRLGSFAELLEWFSLDSAVSDIEDISKGKVSADDIIQDIPKNMYDKVINMISPFIKIIPELRSGESLYPSASDPTPIRDGMEHFLRMWGLENVYNYAAKKPHYNLKETLIGAVVYSRDFKESAYSDVYGYKDRFKGKEDNLDYTPDAKANSIYYMKKAMKLKQKKVALHQMDLYFENGGTATGLNNSFARLDPLYGLGKKQGEKPLHRNEVNKISNEYGVDKERVTERLRDFINFLDGNEKDKFKIAIKYYQDELMLPANVTELLKKKDITDVGAKNVLTKYINAKVN